MQEVDRHVASLSRRYVKEDLARERRLVEAEGGDPGGRTGETWTDQSELALGRVDIDYRWIDEVNAARSLKDADEVSNLFRCQTGVGSLAT